MACIALSSWELKLLCSSTSLSKAHILSHVLLLHFPLSNIPHPSDMRASVQPSRESLHLLVFSSSSFLFHAPSQLFCLCIHHTPPSPSPLSSCRSASVCQVQEERRKSIALTSLTCHPSPSRLEARSLCLEGRTTCWLPVGAGSKRASLGSWPLIFLLRSALYGELLGTKTVFIHRY